MPGKTITIGVSLLLIGLLSGVSYLGYRNTILAKFDTANTHYANNAYLLAAASYLDVLDSVLAFEEHETAAYLLAITLRTLVNQTEMQQFIENHPSIHPYFTEVLSRWRTQGQHQAREALAYLAFINQPYSRASIRLLNHMDTHLPTLASSITHHRAWTVNTAGITNIATDPQGKLWAVATNPSRLLRYDYFGHIVQEIPFTLPKEQSIGQDINFTALADGDFIIAHTKFDRHGNEIEYLPFDNRLKDITRSGNQQILVLLNDGIQAYNASFNPLWEKIGHGAKPESFNTTTAIASNRQYIVILSGYRLQVFDLAGELQSFVDGKFSWAWDVSIDSNGFIYLGSVNGQRVDIYNQRAEKISTLKTGGDHLTVAAKDILYSIDDETLTAHYPTSPVISAITPPVLAAPPPNPTPSQPQDNKLSFELTPLARYPHITVHSNTEWILDEAYTNNEEATIWLGTTGGLVAYRPDQDQWQKWTVAEGLPDAQIRRIVADDNYLWMISGYHFIRFNLQDHTIDNIEPVSGRSFGVRDIIPDKNNADWLWLLTEDKLIRYAKSSHSGNIIATLTSGISIQQIHNGDIVVNDSYTQLLRINPVTTSATTLVNIEDIVALTPRSPRMSRDTWFGDITVDDQRGGLWIGMYYDHQQFFFDYTSHTLKRVTIDPHAIAHCQRGASKIELIENQTYYIGQQCIAKLSNDGKTWQPLIQNPTLTRGRLFQSTPEPPLWFSSNNGLLHIHLLNKTKDSTATPHRPPWETFSSFTHDLLVIENNIWVGSSGGEVRIFNTKTRHWNTLPNVSAGKLRLYDSRVIAISNRHLYSINPNDLTVKELRLGKRPWKSLNDLAFDGTTWWAAGGQDDRDSAGLRAWDGVKEQRWTRTEGMPFGKINQLLLDPYQTDFIWLASNDGLIRFSKHNQTADVIKSGYITHIEIHENTLYAVTGHRLFIWDCESAQSQEIDVSTDTPLDPIPDRLKWHFYHALSSELKSILKIYPGYTHDAALTGEKEKQTVWLSTHHGVFEMALPTSTTAEADTRN